MTRSIGRERLVNKDTFIKHYANWTKTITNRMLVII